MFKGNNKNTRTTDVVLVFLLLNLNISFSSVSIVDFEQVNVSCITLTIVQRLVLQLSNPSNVNMHFFAAV